MAMLTMAILTTAILTMAMLTMAMLTMASLRIDVVAVPLMHAALGVDCLRKIDLEEAESLALVADGARVEAGPDDDDLALLASCTARRGEEGLGALV